MEFVWFVTHEGERVSRFQHYTNPLRFTDAEADADADAVADAEAEAEEEAPPA
jgi:hypothetical protein